MACLFIPSPASAVPGNEEEMQCTVELDVSEIYLFNLIKEIDGYLSDGNLHTVMLRLMSHFEMPIEKVDITYIGPLKSKLSPFCTSWVNYKRITSGKKKLFHKCDNSST